ncbi:DUF805 domain-containing protein [Pseudomonas sp. F1_0610]|uniref:DUF805 domain-containing protein n=1 Tax=Pseudomonas sp. F1_0610 TaxID=3114284 RepID=UPI0039C3E88A
MDQKNCKVIFKGELLPLITKEQALESLSRLFKQPREVVEKLFAGSPVTLKSGLTSAQADNYIETLLHIGVVTHKQLDKPASSLWTVEAIEDEYSTATRNGDNSWTCPKCYTKQPTSDTCSNCGLIVSKFNAQQHAVSQASVVSSAYTTPQSSSAFTEEYEEEFKLATFQGRIGRLRFLAWPFYSNLIAIALGILIVFIGGESFINQVILIGNQAAKDPDSVSTLDLFFKTGFAGILLGILALAINIFLLMIYIRRAHDIGLPTAVGTLLYFIPHILGVISNHLAAGWATVLIWIALFLIPGGNLKNNYGYAPPDNTLAIHIAAFLHAALLIIVFLLAIKGL